MIYADRHARRYSVPLDLMVQAGRIALWRAEQLYDPARGIRFITYLCHWLRGTMRRMAVLERDHIRIPESELSRGIRIDYSHIDTPLDGDEGNTLADILPDTAPQRPEFDTHDALHRAIDALPPDLRRTIHVVFFEDARGDRAAARLGVIRQRVHQRIHEALKLLRQKLNEAELG